VLEVAIANRLRGIGLVFVFTGCLLVLGVTTEAHSAVGLAVADGAPTTIVSLTFDDGYKSQYLKAAPILDAYGVHGTFYVNSGLIGTESWKMAWQDLTNLQARGHEIGGHSTYHPDFRDLDPDEITRQVCNDRSRLVSQGLRVTSFAYPFGHGAHDPSIRSVVEACGYNSARRTKGLHPPGGCTWPRCSEQIPPADPYGIRIRDQPGTLDLNWLEGAVQGVEQSGGGWLPIMIHKVCDGCTRHALSTQTLDAFLAWMSERSSQGTVIETVDEVIGGEVAPPVQGPPPASRSGNLLIDPSLEIPSPVPHGHSLPAQCWSGRAANWGRFTATWSATSDAHTGSTAINMTVSSMGKNAQAAFVVVHDLGMCAVTTAPGTTYDFSAWYRSDVPVALVASVQVDDLDWAPLSPIQSFPAANDWTEAKTSLTVPADPLTTEISIGLALSQAGAVSMDDFSLTEIPP